MTLQAPFPWFGGKRRVASIVWARLGDVDNYVEPFFGSGAVLLGRPHPAGTETVNDADGFISNFWRAITHDPEAVAHHADWPVNENDLHARHAHLVGLRDDFTRRLEGDPEFYDAKVAGWWVWGVCCWIGSGWCSGTGPWRVVEVDSNDGRGVNRQLVHLGNDGQGVNRKLVHLGDDGRGVNRQLVHLGDDGRGVNRQLVHLGDDGQGVNRKRADALAVWFAELSERLRDVRVCCGDWTRVTSPTVTVRRGLTGVFLDPPYADTADRTPDLYSRDSLDIAHDVRRWAIANGQDPMMRIALCGYEGEHEMPDDWATVRWKAAGGYGAQSKTSGNRGLANAKRECIWFSPSCIGAGLWDAA